MDDQRANREGSDLRSGLKELLIAFTIVSLVCLLLAGLMWFANAVGTRLDENAINRYQESHPEKK